MRPVVLIGCILTLVLPASANKRKGGGASPAISGADDSRPSLRGPMPFKGLRAFQRTVAKHLQRHPEDVFVEKVTEDKVVALTFDDGPDPKATPRLLSILREHDIKATFFLVGERAKRYPGLVRAIVADGHAVAGHGFTHTDHRKKSPKGAYAFHAAATNRILEPIAGGPITYFRPPYGAMTGAQIGYFGDRGIRTVLWSVDSLDWHQSHDTAKQVQKRVLAQVHPGAIVLLHSGRRRVHTARALGPIIVELARRGYQFARVDELLKFN